MMGSPHGELVLQAEQPREIAQREQSFLDIIASAARDPRVDIDKMQKLLEMKERIDAKAAETAFHVAMKDAQNEMQPIVRDAENSHTKSRYARLETIDERIRPVYTSHGFSLTFDSPEFEKDGVTVSCDVLHEAGHRRPYKLAGALDGVGSQGKANKTNIQALGSTVSYLRRYLTMMIFNLVLKNEDDDGNGGKGGAINEHQVNQIEDLLAECGAANDPQVRARFLSMMCVESVQKIQVANFKIAINALESKRRQAR